MAAIHSQVLCVSKTAAAQVTCCAALCGSEDQGRIQAVTDLALLPEAAGWENQHLLQAEAPSASPHAQVGIK